MKNKHKNDSHSDKKKNRPEEMKGELKGQGMFNVERTWRRGSLLLCYY